MKKIIMLALSVLVVLSLVACGSNNEATQTEPKLDGKGAEATQDEPYLDGSGEGMIENIDGNDSVEVPNPFIETKTIDTAETIANFNITDIANVLTDYSIDSIYAVNEEMIEINYEKDDIVICYRKAIGKDDISGDYNTYDEYKTIEINDISISTKGKNSKINVATWYNGGFAYSLTTRVDCEGFSVELLEEIVNNIG